MSAAEKLLNRLERVRESVPGRWTARCPSHEDRGPSLSVRELDDGRVLIHCFAGCGASDVVAAVGLELADLFPERPSDHRRKGVKPAVPARDVLRAIAHEVRVVALVAEDLANGKELSDENRERLWTAVARISRGAALANG